MNVATLKKSILILALIAGSGTAQAAGGGVATRDIVIGINDVFIPGNLDNRAEAYVVVSGIFPNGCYRWKQADVNHVTDTTHEITSKAAVTQGMCIQVLIPFSREIKLGHLAIGTHTLKFMSNDGTYMERQLVIE
jgi:hypothetical protein